jgi:hypothetical protein
VRGQRLANRHAERIQSIGAVDPQQNDAIARLFSQQL